MAAVTRLILPVHVIKDTLENFDTFDGFFYSQILAVLLGVLTVATCLILPAHVTKGILENIGITENIKILRGFENFDNEKK